MSKPVLVDAIREVLRLRLGFTWRGGILTALVLVLLAVSFAFTLGSSAHNIDLHQARVKAQEYARRVRDESNGKYLHYETSCRTMFGDHNHYVQCSIRYDNAGTMNAKDGSAACRETIQVYFQAHRDVRRFDYWMKHVSDACGKKVLVGPDP